MPTPNECPYGVYRRCYARVWTTQKRKRLIAMARASVPISIVVGNTALERSCIEVFTPRDTTLGTTPNADLIDSWLHKRDWYRDLDQEAYIYSGVAITLRPAQRTTKPDESWLDLLVYDRTDLHPGLLFEVWRLEEYGHRLFAALNITLVERAKKSGFWR